MTSKQDFTLFPHDLSEPATRTENICLSSSHHPCSRSLRLTHLPLSMLPISWLVYILSSILMGIMGKKEALPVQSVSGP
jgi:hypothetical protein